MVDRLPVRLTLRAAAHSVAMWGAPPHRERRIAVTMDVPPARVKRKRWRGDEKKTSPSVPPAPGVIGDVEQEAEVEIVVNVVVPEVANSNGRDGGGT